MTPRTIRLPLLLTALVLLGASQARGEMIDFSYQWSVLPSSVIPGGTGSVTLATAPDGASQATLGSSSPTIIPGASVTTTSSADPATPEALEALIAANSGFTSGYGTDEVSARASALASASGSPGSTSNASTPSVATLR